MILLKKYGLYIILGILICISCNNTEYVYEKIETINAGLWNKNHTVSFIVPANDSLKYYDLQVYIRNRNDYSYSNLYLFITVTAPTGATVTDTIQYILANNEGKWIGKGFSQLWDNRFPFRNNVRFGNKGNYVFNIKHGMREDELIGITDVGVSLMEK